MAMEACCSEHDVPATAEEAAMLQVAHAIERALDDEIAKVDEMDDDDYSRLREKRMKQLKEMQKRKEGWIAKGHGSFTEITDPKDFFNACKSSERVVVHFSRRATERCNIVNSHLRTVAQRHFETRFLQVDVEKLGPLAEQFNVMMLPTIMLVEGGNTFHAIIGFDEFGGVDDFKTDVMEKVLCHYGMINDKDMFAADQTRDD